MSVGTLVLLNVRGPHKKPLMAEVGKERIKISSGQRCTVLEELSESCTKLCRDPFRLLNTKQLPTYVKEKL